MKLEEQAKVNNAQFRKLLRWWGWVQNAGSERYFFRKGSTLVSVDRSSGGHPTELDISLAAAEDKVNVNEWMKGPKDRNDPSVKPLSDDDLTFFLEVRPGELNLPSKSARFERIRHKMASQGTEKEYIKVREKRQRVLDKQTQEKLVRTPVKKSEVKIPKGSAKPSKAPSKPLDLTFSDQGYTSLDQVLALRGLKKNELSRTGCEILVALTQGDVENSSGRATSMLLEMLPAHYKEKKPLGITGLNNNLKKWEEQEVIWRETNGKRTYKIGLCVPIRLTSAEISEYLLPSEPEPEPEQEPILDFMDETPEDLTIPTLGTAVHAPVVDSDMGGAIELLKSEYHDLISRAEGLKSAIELLGGNVDVS